MKRSFEEEEIRALSWKQPYASLMLHGKIETRTWSTKYRGKVLICASKQSYSTKQVQNISGPLGYTDILITLSRNKVDASISGKAIAIAELVDCRPMTPEDEKKCYVQYREGLWCHVYENIEPIQPFNWKGTQGWKKLDRFQHQDVKIAKSIYDENQLKNK